MADVDKRIKLQYELEAIAGKGHVWFQPPMNTKMVYPAIVYTVNDIIDKNANNKKYIHKTMYKVTIIDEDPDSELAEQIGELPTTGFNTSYQQDGLNHFVYTIY